MKIYFVTANEKKIAESDERLKRFVERVETQERIRLEIDICPFKKHLDELLAPDIEKIVRKKAIEAYRVVHLPCVVEHGGLFLDAWQGNPGLLGGIGQVVWDAVGDRMCDFLRAEDTRGAKAQSVIGYCDGRRVRVYSGITKGEVTEHARGDRGFRWDPIFKPADSDLTYGEMAPEVKRATSPDEKAWDLFFQSVRAELLQARKK
jgi:XTP/dITP diphosphohydrolase